MKPVSCESGPQLQLKRHVPRIVSRDLGRCNELRRGLHSLVTTWYLKFKSPKNSLQQLSHHHLEKRCTTDPERFVLSS